METRKKIEKLDVQKVLELRNSGMTQQQIADIFNTSKGGINNILKANGKTSSLEDIKLNVNEILKLHGEGKSNPEIAKQLNCSRSKVLDIIKEHGLVGNRTKNNKAHVKLFDPTKEELVILLETNTIETIADMFNTSSVTVWKRMKDFDVKSPRNK